MFCRRFWGRRWGCERAVLPRNSAVFGRSEGAARRFSARRTAAGWLGEKIFKKGGEKGEKPKIGVQEVPEGGPRAPYIGCVGRFLGAICSSGG